MESRKIQFKIKEGEKQYIKQKQGVQQVQPLQFVWLN